MKKILVFLFILLLILTGCGNKETETSLNQNNEMQNTIEELQNKIKGLEEEISTKNEKISNLEQLIEELLNKATDSNMSQQQNNNQNDTKNEIQVGDMNVRLEKVGTGKSYKVDSGVHTYNAKEEYLAVQVTIRNIGKFDQDQTKIFYTLIDEDDTRYNPSALNQCKFTTNSNKEIILASSGYIFENALRPNESFTATIIFDVSSTDKAHELEIMSIDKENNKETGKIQIVK